MKYWDSFKETTMMQEKTMHTSHSENQKAFCEHTDKQRGTQGTYEYISNIQGALVPIAIGL